MEKQQIVSFIQSQLAAGKISKSDLIGIASAGVITQGEGSVVISNEELPTRQDNSKKLINIFYGIGTIIAIIGIGILVSQNWREIGFAGRIIVSLGISLAMYISAMLLNKPQQNAISQVMFIISALLAPLGIYVLLKEANVSFDLSSHLATAIGLFVIYCIALIATKKNILILISVGFATWTYFAFVVKIFNSAFHLESIYIKWAIIILGLSYLLIARGIQNVFSSVDSSNGKSKRVYQNILYSAGTSAILGAGISIGGTMDLVLILLIFGAFYGSVYLRCRSMLILGALFLIGHIIKLTSRFFANSIGWPVALILIGSFVIAIGSLTYYINRKYITSNNPLN